jgi:hypothetical protein
MRSEFVQVGINVINEELRRIRKELVVEETQKGKSEALVETKAFKNEGMVFLFTGYMISNPLKKENQFPPEKETEVKQAIDAILDKYNAGPDDLAVTTGMDAGSEILFVESCAEHKVPVQSYFPLPEAPYVRDCFSPGGEQWVERFYTMRNHRLVEEYYQSDCVGTPKESVNLHERNNRWALYSALGRGIDKVRLIAFWDGKNEAPQDMDARLVKHMVDLMRDTGGMIEQINLNKPPQLPKTEIAVEIQPVAIQPVEQKLSSNGKTVKKPGAHKKKQSR